MSLEDDYLKIFRISKQEMSQMSLKERSALVNKRIHEIESEINHYNMFQKPNDGYFFINVSNLIDLKDYILSSMEALNFNIRNSDSYLTKFSNMLEKEFSYDTNIILSLPAYFAISKKATNYDVDIESYLLAKDKNGFHVVTFKVDDEPIITRNISITKEKAKEFFYKSNRNTGKEDMIDIFEINNKHY